MQLDDDARAVVERAVPDAEHVWPLSPLQEGLHFESTYDTSVRDPYTATTVIELERPLDSAILRHALAAVFARHAALRAGFVHEGLPRTLQVVARRVDVPLDEVQLPAGDEDGALERLVEDHGRRRFDLTRAPLMRCTVARAGDGRQWIVLTNHTLLLDGWSATLFFDDLLALCAFPDEPLAPAPSFGRYLDWLGGQDRAAAVEAWRRALGGLDEAGLVAPTASGRDFEPERLWTGIDAQLTASVEAAAREHGLTLNSVLAGAWGIVVGRLTGRDDVVFGSTVSGRPPEIAGVERIVGQFLNTVAVRVSLRPAEPLAAFLHRLQREQAALIGVHHASLGDVQRAAGLGPLFDTLQVLRNTPVDEEGRARAAAALGVRGISGADSTHLPLTFTTDRGEALAFEWTYRPDVFDRARVEAISAHVVAVLEQFAGGAGLPVGRIEPPAAADERRRIRAQSAGRAQPLPYTTIADMLDERAAMVPDELALVCGDERLTYAELDARINRLARLLLAHGAGPERVVALALPRNADIVAALFAVLQTGAAYLPLDPGYPADRLELMLADAAPVCLLTTAAARLACDAIARVDLDDGATVARLAAFSGGPLSDAERPRFASDDPRRLEHPAYVIYTSGSTGMPKGVVTPHRGLTNMQLNHRAQIFDPVVAAAGGGGCGSPIPSRSRSTCRGRSCCGSSRVTRSTSPTRSFGATRKGSWRTRRASASTCSTSRRRTRRSSSSRACSTASSARRSCCSAARRSPTASGSGCARPTACSATTSTARRSTRSTRSAEGRTTARRRPSGGRSSTRARTCSTPRCARCRPVSRASCTSPGSAWRAAISSVRA